MQNNIIESCKKYMLIGGQIDRYKDYHLTQKANLKSIENNLQNSKMKEYALNQYAIKGSNKSAVQSSKPSLTDNVAQKSIKSPIQSSKPSLTHSVARGSKGYHLQDTLFWSFFTILKGDQEYELDHSFKREKEFKIESIEKLRTIKTELKAYKLRLNDIESELLHEKKITTKSLVALCLLYKINIMYVCNRTYFEIINDIDKKMNIIINENRENKILEDLNDEKVNYYREKYLYIDNISKPLKSITSYTRDELINMVEKLDIKDISSKKTKKEMYEKIIAIIV